ncbi:phosphohydrolase [Roseibium aquae]|uniref:Phosphohydrolase n=1 Tax=Roseibium aquae TaxID=1323746 RepID=A0A916WVX9_9HYPH|nr:HD-GYP domain-containing protein [Roseibium aquae]GGB34808.1 phosphohydrolase [Roseibium aquae]
MDLVLISDGEAVKGSLLKKLPLFFSARLIDMKDLGSKSISPAKVAAIDFTGASPLALRKLAASIKTAGDAAIVCLVNKSIRREVVQATSLGHVVLFDKELGLKALVRQIRSHFAEPINVEALENAPIASQAAFSKATQFLNELMFSSAIPDDVPLQIMNRAAGALSVAIERDGIQGWMGTVQHHHSFTFRHSLHVAGLATAFAQSLGWPEPDCAEIAAGGLLHDIGKTRIPLSILDKPGRLSDEERALINMHPEFGREILKTQLDIPRDLKKMAVQHHELLDGTGYPAGLSGDQIDVKVRLMTICDIFAALTEKRSYKRALSPREAYGELRGMGGKLDADLVRKFRSVVLGMDFGDLKADAKPLLAQNQASPVVQGR